MASVLCALDQIFTLRTSNNNWAGTRLPLMIMLPITNILDTVNKDELEVIKKTRATAKATVRAITRMHVIHTMTIELTLAVQ